MDESKVVTAMHKLIREGVGKLQTAEEKLEGILDQLKIYRGLSLRTSYHCSLWIGQMGSGKNAGHVGRSILGSKPQTIYNNLEYED